MEQNNTALLVMDMQAGILSRLPTAPELLKIVAAVIKGARRKSIPVIYVTLGFRHSAPEISPNNKSFSAGKSQFDKTDMAAFMTIDASIAPLAHEFRVVKRRVSAFSGSDLEVLLRAQGIQHLVLSGVSTSGVVLSTLREAADRDYELTVISDACADSDDEVHRLLMSKVFVKQAAVLNAADWLGLQ